MHWALSSSEERIILMNYDITLIPQVHNSLCRLFGLRNPRQTSATISASRSSYPPCSELSHLKDLTWVSSLAHTIVQVYKGF